MGTACIEAKLLHQLLKMEQKTLYFIFLDLQKTYNTVDRKQLLEILEGYGVGPNALGPLKFYWDNQRCVAEWEIPWRDFCPLLWCTTGQYGVPYYFNVHIDAVVQIYLADVMDDMTITSTTLGVCPHYCMLMTAQFYPWIMNGYRMRISTSVIFSEIAPA